VATVRNQMGDAGAEDAHLLSLNTLTVCLKAATEAFETYGETALTVGLTRGTGLRATLAAPIASVETELAQWWPNVEAISSKLQELKRFEARFLTSPGEDTAGRLRKAANELDFAVFGGPFGNETKAALSTALMGYTKTLKAYVAAVNARAGAWAALQGAFDAMSAEARDLSRIAAARAAAAKIEEAGGRR